MDDRSFTSDVDSLRVKLSFILFLSNHVFHLIFPLIDLAHFAELL